MQLVQTKDMSHDAWLKERRKGIGGSDAAAILGLNRYMSPTDVYANKLGLIGELDDNEAMRQGRDFEEYVASRFGEITGKKVRRKNALLKHNVFPWMIGNIDRLIVGEKAGLECKTTSVLNRSRFKNGEYPDTYYVQCMHYLAVTGFEKWYLAVLILNQGFHVFEISRDEEEISALVAAEKHFWEENVLKQIPPAFDGSPAASECLKAMYPKATEHETCLLYGMEDKITQYLELDSQVKGLSKTQEMLKQEIQGAMMTAEEGRANGYIVNWKNRTRTNFDAKRLQSDNPDFYNRYLKESTTYRIFEIKEAK